MKTLLPPRFAEYATFILVGGVNTAVTYAIYLLLSLTLTYQVAYGISFLLGILLSYYLNSRFVFDVKMSWSGLMRFPTIYLVQYLAGSLLLGALVEVLDVPERYAPLVVTIVLVPATFFMTRFILRINSKHR